MDNPTSKDLALFRLERAEECLNSALADLSMDDLKSAANRSYYCIFHVMRAVLALDRFDSKKHSGIISAFRQRYIKTGIFSAAFSKTIANAFELRNNSDYEDFYVVAKSDVVEQIENARVFLQAANSYIDRVGSG